MLVISRGPSVIGKTMVWATKVVGRGVVNDVFKNDHYMGFLLRKYRENGQNHTFRTFEPLNSLFYANFIAYPLGADARHILGKIWGVKIFVLGQGGPRKGSKMAIFEHF